MFDLTGLTKKADYAFPCGSCSFFMYLVASTVSKIHGVVITVTLLLISFGRDHCCFEKLGYLELCAVIYFLNKVSNSQNVGFKLSLKLIQYSFWELSQGVIRRMGKFAPTTRTSGTEAWGVLKGTVLR